jgi:anthranilate phosphoribosyltransferase
MIVSEFTARFDRGEHLSLDEMAAVIDWFMQGQCPDEDMAAFLLALRAKGETVDEIAGAARALRTHMIPIRTSRPGVLDTCGTGGDASATFNISTAAALVAAAAGVPVAKHGNRSVTSRSGSADVLIALGVDIEAPVEIVERCLEQVGLCFCFAPLLHPAMGHAAPVRRRLGVPTIFNLLGPLCNPASAPFQLLGVGRAGLRPLLAAALQQLGGQRAVVLCGQDGLDEVTLAAETDISEVTPQGVRLARWSPEMFGLARSSLDALRVDGPQASAEMIRQVLAGRAGPAREIVLLNAAAALWTVRQVESLRDGATLAAEVLDSGAAQQRLTELIEASHSR